jgi:hypothetical protein
MDQQPIGPSSPLSLRRRNRARRALAVLVALVVIASGVFSYLYFSGTLALRLAEADLQAALAEVNTAEPNGWQWEDLEAQRAKIPDDQNGARIVVETAKLFPEEKWRGEPIFFDLIKGLPPPVKLTAQQTDILRVFMKGLEAGLEKGRTLVDYPGGRFPPIIWSRDIISTQPPHLRDVRDVGNALGCDALLQCQERQYGQAWKSAQAALHAGRSLGDEPHEQSQFARMAMQLIAVEAMERILGHGEVDAGRLQLAAALLRDEVDRNLAIIGIRGERALQHAFFSKVESGQFRLNDVAGWREGMQPWWENAGETAKRTMLASAHAYELRLTTRGVDCARQPVNERDERFTKWRDAHDDLQKRERVPKLAERLSQRSSIGGAEVMFDSRMECAITAMTAEIFRMQWKRWPNDLNELVAAKLLPKVPTDLYGSRPMQFRVADDGVVVWSGGFSYAGNAWDDLSSPPRLSTTRKEFRLWNPDRRAQPPVPLRVPDER